MNEIKISQETLVCAGVVFVMVWGSLEGINSCDERLNRDRALCEKYSTTIQEYDNCLVTRRRIER